MLSVKSPIRKTISKLSKYFLSFIPLSFLNKLTQISILRQEFSDLKKTAVFYKREQMWDSLIKNIGDTEKVIYIEFGVWKGYSIKYFASKNKNKDSLFIGLDSFKGLPEDWKEGALKGEFSLDGKIPIFEDKRVKIIDGYFQDTRFKLIEEINNIKSHINDYKLIVNYDPDLYSSTLFALTLIDSLNKDYIAIFDEIYDQECRAFFDYIQSFSPSIKFLGRVAHKDCDAVQAACEIKVKVN